MKANLNSCKTNLTIFKCSICKSYFEEYSQATVHLALSHPNDLNWLKNCKGESGESKPTSLIDTFNLLQPFIPLQRSTFVKRHVHVPSRLKIRPISKRPTFATKRVAKPASNSSRSRKSNSCESKPNAVKPEISLDLLKASEIEKLIKDLCSKNKPKAKASGSKLKV